MNNNHIFNLSLHTGRQNQNDESLKYTLASDDGGGGIREFYVESSTAENIIKLIINKIQYISINNAHLRYIFNDVMHIKNIESLEKFKVEIKKWTPNVCPCRLCKTYISGVGYLDILKTS